MKIIIPMAGMGKRMRPHTLSIPKPLIPIAGKPIVQRLVEDIMKTVNEKVTEIAFIIGNFGKEVEENLKHIAFSMGAEPKIYYQNEALGTAHAIYCAADSLNDNVVVAFADTLFIADFKLNVNNDSIIWVQKVENPSLYGVVKLNKENIITEFIEKPKQFITDLAIIGIYYFKDGENLKAELKYLLDNKIMVKGEYQLTDALENMKKKGLQFSIGKVDEWLDCGNKDATVFTNQRILEKLKNQNLVSKSAKITNSTIVSPCYIGDNAIIQDSVVGPHVSVGNNSAIYNSVIKNTIIQNNTLIRNSVLRNSMIGNYVEYKSPISEVNIGDFTMID